MVALGKQLILVKIAMRSNCHFSLISKYSGIFMHGLYALIPNRPSIDVKNGVFSGNTKTFQLS